MEKLLVSLGVALNLMSDRRVPSGRHLGAR